MVGPMRSILLSDTPEDVGHDASNTTLSFVVELSGFKTA